MKFLNFSIHWGLPILIIALILLGCSSNNEKMRAQCLQADSIRADSLRKLEYHQRSMAKHLLSNTTMDTVKSHSNKEKVESSISEYVKKKPKKLNKPKDKTTLENSAPRL